MGLIPETKGKGVTWVVAALSLGLLLGSVWASRDQVVFSSAAFVPLNRVMSILALLALAALGTRLSLHPRGCAIAGTLAYGVHLLAVALALFMEDAATLFALGLASTFFEGIAIAILETVVMYYSLSLEPRQGAALAATGFLIGQVYDCVFMNASPMVAAVQWLTGSAVAYGLLWWLLRRVPGDWGARAILCGSDGRGQAGRVWGFSTIDWLLLAFMAVVLLQYGITQGLTGFGGIGKAAHYGLAAGVVMVIVRTVVAGLCAVQPHWLPNRLTSVVLVLWVMALCGTLCSWGTALSMAADWMRTAVYYALQVLPIVYALECARLRPSYSLPMLAVGIAVATSNQIARLVGWAAGLGALSADYRMVVLIAAICIVGSVVFALPVLLASPAEKPAPSAAAHVPAARLADPASPTVERAVDFARRFDAVCALHNVPPGEREALLQAVHGYTIDNTAANLGLSRETVKTSLSRAYTRMGVNGKQAFLALMEEME